MNKSKKHQTILMAVTALLIASFACSFSPSATATPAPAATTEVKVEAPAETSPACGVFDSIPASAEYNTAPELLIDTTSNYFANVKMANGGEFKIALYADKAPITVNSFVFLACKGFFNGITYHRVLDGFMAQGGDPTGSGMGGPGYEFVNEDSDLTFDKAGVLAMANAGRDTNGSQFFITFAPADFLNGGYTIFGQVVSGMDVVNNITRRDPEQSPSFIGDAMESVTITIE